MCMVSECCLRCRACPPPWPRGGTSRRLQTRHQLSLRRRTSAQVHASTSAMGRSAAGSRGGWARRRASTPCAGGLGAKVSGTAILSNGTERCEGQDERSRGLPMTLRRVLYTALLCGALLAPPSAMPVHAAEVGAHASIASTCGGGSSVRQDRSTARSGDTACAFTVQLGVLDGSRLQLMRQALQRRDAVRRALHRDVDFQVDVDSQGGEIFAALRIGRLCGQRERQSLLAGELPASAPVSSC